MINIKRHIGKLLKEEFNREVSFHMYKKYGRNEYEIHFEHTDNIPESVCKYISIVGYNITYITYCTIGNLIIGIEYGKI